MKAQSLALLRESLDYAAAGHGMTQNLGIILAHIVADEQERRHRRWLAWEARKQRAREQNQAAGEKVQ